MVRSTRNVLLHKANTSPRANTEATISFQRNSMHLDNREAMCLHAVPRSHEFQPTPQSHYLSQARGTYEAETAVRKCQHRNSNVNYIEETVFSSLLFSTGRSAAVACPNTF